MGAACVVVVVVVVVVILEPGRQSVGGPGLGLLDPGTQGGLVAGKGKVGADSPPQLASNGPGGLSAGFEQLGFWALPGGHSPTPRSTSRRG